MGEIDELERRLSLAEERIKKDESLAKQFRSIPNLVALTALFLTLFQFLISYIDSKNQTEEWNEEALQTDISMLLYDVSLYESSRDRSASDSISIRQKLVALESQAKLRHQDIDLLSTIGIAYKALNNLKKSREYLYQSIEISLREKDYDRASQLVGELLTVEVWNLTELTLNSNEFNKSLKVADRIHSALQDPVKLYFREGVLIRTWIQVCLKKGDQKCVTQHLESLLEQESFDANFIYRTLKSIRMKFGSDLSDDNQWLFEGIVSSFEEKSGARVNTQLSDLL